MIERWFPCAEVSQSSESGWGSGSTERSLFTWWAARPAAQAKAAVICSLLPWPENEPDQKRLQSLVQRSLTGRYAAHDELYAEIIKANPDGVSVLDPFSGRGMIPLEAARLGIPSYAIEYAPVAVLASELLTDYPFRDWSQEPSLPFEKKGNGLIETQSRLVGDVEAVLKQVGHRLSASMAGHYRPVNGRQPWGYLWAVTLPCQECGLRFPLVGSYELRHASSRKRRKGSAPINDQGQSFYIEADAHSGVFRAVVHDGPPRHTPTLASAVGADGRKIKGKAAICPFCGHPLPLAVHQRLAYDGFGRDALLLIADLDDEYGKVFRSPTEDEASDASGAEQALVAETPFGPLLPAVPDEAIPLNNGATIRPQLYGAKTYGDLMCDRQTLSFVRLARIISGLGEELHGAGLSPDYTKALVGYAAANLVRQLRYSTRGSWLRARDKGTVEVAGIFVNESTVGFSYDFFEAGVGEGPGTWSSLADSSVSTLRSLLHDAHGTPTLVVRGSAADIIMRDDAVAAVVTDPPYDSMVYYSDLSDLFYVWLKRALHLTWPDMTITLDLHGLQDKSDEIIVKEHGKAPGEHRDRKFYDTRIAKAFSEMRRVVRDDGLVTIVFGHGEPEVWQRFLGAIESAGLVMTASWPANTESGGQQDKANIETTLTMACRPAPAGRPAGRRATVESEIKAEIKRRYPDWERWGLAPTDMLMAAAGPAMEVVGRFSEVLDARGEAVPIDKFLPLARAAVQEAMAVEVDHHPLETFDARTRFALWWVRLFGRGIAPKSELRWQTLAASLDLDEVRDLVPDVDKGCQFVSAAKHNLEISPESSVIDVVLALGRTSDQGLAAMGEVFAASGRQPDDAYLWSAAKFLADRLPDSDPDAIAFTRVLRNRAGVGNAAAAVHVAGSDAAKERERQEAQLKLF